MRQSVSRTKIGKNVTVVTDFLPHVSSITLGVWIDRGSRDENEREMGLSHFYEHMIFKGTAKSSPEDIARTLERSGGSINAFTGREQVCVHAKFVDKELRTACELINDIFLNSSFDAGELEKERLVILEEIKGCDDNPEEFVHDGIMECLWPEISLGWPITGRDNHVRAFSRQDILHMSELMRSSRIIVAASGNVDHKKLCLYAKPLVALKMGQSKRMLPELSSPVRKYFIKPIQQVNFSAAFRIPSFVHKDKYPLLVLNAILGDGMSSRLFQNIRERLGLAYSVYSFMEANIDNGIIGFFLGTDPENLGKALNALFEELNSIKTRGVGAKEVDFAKTYLCGSIMLGMENTSNRMGQIAKSELYWRRLEPVEVAIKRIEKVTQKDIVDVANRYFSDSNMAICTASPKIKNIDKLVMKARF